MSTPIDAFIGAVNFCTGSQTDYATCIANNMRFTPFLTDTFEASGYSGLKIKKLDIPTLYGDVYTDLLPIAIANILTRVKMTNSYGGVSFRCPDVFSRPRLPLPRLQDLGIEAQDIINIIGIDPTLPEEDEEDTLEFEGIPISPNDDLLGWMYNVINLLIGYTTSVSNTMTTGKEIKGIILGMMDYYVLPEKTLLMRDEATKSLNIYNEAIRYLNKVVGDSLLNSTMGEISFYIAIAESYMITVRQQISTSIVQPLSIITPATNFTTFDFTITDGVANTIVNQESAYYPYIFSYSMQAKNTSGVYGIPPLYPKDNIIVAKKIVDIYSTIIRNTVADSLQIISSLYQVSNVELTLDKLRASRLFYTDLKSRQAYYIDSVKVIIPDITEEELKYQTIINTTENLIDIFTFGTLIQDIETVYDPEDYATNDSVQKITDEYYISYGNASSTAMAADADAQQALYNAIPGITEIFLGGDYKDAGKFYYADLAYAVGYAKLEQIKSIQIDEEYYEIVTGGGISESGCVKYTFTRHVLPTYNVEVSMYIYPGTPDQPYCPTINMYHNFLTSKYAGMFTKQDGENMGLFVFTGYKPMLQTVESVVKIGSMDYNSINLNDPSLDEKAYETMVMKELKNLTNASSINDEPLSTEDFKYYLSSTLVDDTIAANYPGLAIIEFKNFPLGSSVKFPNVRVNVVGGDLL